MQRNKFRSTENDIPLNIFVNSSLVQACIIHELLKVKTGYSVVIQCRGMKTEFLGLDKEYSCVDEAMINSIKIVSNIVKDLKDTSKNIQHWTVHISHGDSLLARIICAAGGRIHYIDDGLGTYAALADFASDGKAFKLLLLRDRLSTRPLFDRGLNYLNRRHWIEGATNNILNLTANLNIHLAALVAAASKRLYKQYFRFDSEKKWKIYLLYNPFPGIKKIQKIQIDLKLNSLNRDGVLILLPPFFQTGSIQFESFLKTASKICRFKKYENIYIKLHPADAGISRSINADKYFTNKPIYVQIQDPVETSFWAYNKKFKEVIAFDTSSTFYARKLIKSDEFIWTDLYESITQMKSGVDIVCDAINSISSLNLFFDKRRALN